MLKINFILVIFLLLPSFLTSQVTIKKAEPRPKIKIINPDYVPEIYNKDIKVPTVNDLKGTPIGLTTNYDVFANSIIRDQIIWWNGPKFANMIRPYPNGTSSLTRRVIYTQIDAVTNEATHIDVFNGQAGFPQIDVDRTDSGIFNGAIGVVAHTHCKLGIYNGTNAFNVKQFAINADPSFQFAGANIWLANSGISNLRGDQYQFFNSTNGTTFINWNSISHFSPSPLFWYANGSVEVGITKSPDETKIIYYGTSMGSVNGSQNYNGISVDSCDQFWTIESTNSGSSWIGKRIEADGVIGLVEGLPDFAPIMDYYSQVDVAIANDGIVHAVANGYGFIFNSTHDTQIRSYYPVLYYNSKTEKWITISDPKIDSNQILGTVATAETPGYPGNSIGNAYPKISESPDGKFIYAIWTGPQFTNDKIDTASDMGICYFRRDLYHTWSTDEGKTWAQPTICSGDKLTSETYGQAAKILRYDKDQERYIADIVYLADLNTGVSIFNGEATDNPIMYYPFTIPCEVAYHDPVGVKSENVPLSYAMYQNYPNPFNPTTTINFDLPEKIKVNLSVYNILGELVETLIDNQLEAGHHQIVWNAANKATGIYFYKLITDKYSSVKKLLLLK